MKRYMRGMMASMLFVAAGAGAQNPGGEHPFFSYSPRSVYGPANWEGECSTGPRQSPVNMITPATAAAARLVDFRFPAVLSNLSVTNTGHGLAVKSDSLGTATNPVGDTFSLSEIHFHYHNEHQRNGTNLDAEGGSIEAEMHMVYDQTNRARAKHAMVVGVFLRMSRADNASSRTLDQILLNPPYQYKSRPVHGAFHIQNLVPRDLLKEAYTYEGSLTTPGCSETVSWYVIPVGIDALSAAALASLKAVNISNSNPPPNHGEAFYVEENNRPVTRNAPVNWLCPSGRCTQEGIAGEDKASSQ